jgi:hypothetical protein
MIVYSKLLSIGAQHQLQKFLSNIDGVNDDFMGAAETSSNPAHWLEACGQGLLEH